MKCIARSQIINEQSPAPLITKYEHLDIERLEQFAQQLLDRLPSGCVIGLVGTLGAGKTRLVQAIAAKAGIDVAEVTSPTFTLLQTHTSERIVLHHLDAYRIHDEDEFIELGVEELFDDDSAWTIVEWADLVSGSMPKQTIWIEIELEPENDWRTITVKTTR
ncbi:tRNA threonylcarbamoyladenosine biosynthesis protein TsaE [Novipirellula aureliae]|uniref:tRNA threonylcarbamoyladenosine biosynthesis protein TsaE n=2 Tax=Novipirellula aureliae TaxID=2527966 RepID=A0A5C6E1X3_9BACT|nr:tRNA threonylcarbamoyladenosine biosynthesis protein TsaE [Novipirellula aureliae]